LRPPIEVKRELAHRASFATLREEKLKVARFLMLVARCVLE
jgi:hypothetical protein